MTDTNNPLDITPSPLTGDEYAELAYLLAQLGILIAIEASETPHAVDPLELVGGMLAIEQLRQKCLFHAEIALAPTPDVSA